MAAKARRLSAPVKREVTFSVHQPIDRWREALRLNAAATGLRRNGSYADAAKLHRSALRILEQSGDRRAVALTLNNLALAVSHLGKDTEAVALFEEAATILRQLGDEEHEGRVIANLGLIHRRRGRYEESDDVLQLALMKLTPASSAYRAVEAELRRAG